MRPEVATIKIGEEGTPVPVQFNPASLRVTTTNQVEDGQPNQVSKPTAFKLDVELLFDTTDPAEGVAAGSDVYELTRAIRDAATASAQGATAAGARSGGTGGSSGNATGTPAASLALVTFSWGTTHYQGYIESLNETLDYWSSDGVPLRSTIQISLKGKTDSFLTGSYGRAASFATNPLPQGPAAVSVPGGTTAPADAAAAGGERSTGRALGALNGLENLRAGAGAGASTGGAFVAGAGAQLQASAGFQLSGGVSAGASLGFGMGASAGLSAGAGLGASVGVGMAAGAGIGGGVGLDAGGNMGVGLSAGASAGAGIGGGTGFGAALGAGASVGGGAGFAATASAQRTGPGGVMYGADASTMSSAGVPASAGAFAGLGSSRGGQTGAAFSADRLLPPPLPPAGASASYDISGRASGGNSQIAASFAARTQVSIW